MCLLFYDYLNGDKVPSFPLNLPSEQHPYYTCSASSDHLVIESFRTNLRKFSPSMMVNIKFFGTFLPVSVKNLLKNNLNLH